ncbi:hypothetical protein [Streptomyces sp. E5N91]|uniref:hypothetical protein n=1 Tax=Streptomyces sp. E5N91 TaxID=1851996 RepID=UPI001290DEBA|nr:hypothetical protein [Streptomyces sp. E5N91]
MREELAFARRPCCEHHAAAEYEVCDAEGSDVVEAVGRQLVEPDVVSVGVDDLIEFVEEFEVVFSASTTSKTDFWTRRPWPLTKSHNAAKAALAGWAGGVGAKGEQ